MKKANIKLIKKILNQFPGSILVIYSPDKADSHPEITEQLNDDGISGIWRRRRKLKTATE